MFKTQLKNILSNWKVALVAFVMMSLAAMWFTMDAIKMVYIVDDGEVTFIRTTETDHLKILEDEGVSFRKEDKVSFTGFLRNTAEINIERSFPVTLVADGKQKEVFVLGGTVSDTLEAADIEYRQEDLISLKLSKPVVEDDLITIQRVDTEVETQIEEIPNKVIVKPSNLIAQGETEIIEPGSIGTREKVFSHRFIDGELVETVLIKEEVTKEPVTEVQLKGTVGAHSGMEPFEGIEIDDSGRPSNAVRVLTNQVATAYSARDGARTASGRAAMVGHVAVNPNDIPYGSRLFIETSDGYMVYGYAIAADTGGAMMSGRVDVDLYFNTMEECRRFGRRNVTIYVLP